jgi:hypothetical protein
MCDGRQGHGERHVVRRNIKVTMTDGTTRDGRQGHVTRDGWHDGLILHFPERTTIPTTQRTRDRRQGRVTRTARARDRHQEHVTDSSPRDGVTVEHLGQRIQIEAPTGYGQVQGRAPVTTLNFFYFFPPPFSQLTNSAASIQDGDFKLFETRAIMRYLAAKKWSDSDWRSQEKWRSLSEHYRSFTSSSEREHCGNGERSSKSTCSCHVTSRTCDARRRDTPTSRPGRVFFFSASVG